MRIISFEHAAQQRIGLKVGSQVIDLSVADPTLPQDLVSLLQSEQDLQSRLANIVDNAPEQAYLQLSDIQFRPLITRPGKIICIGRNYAAHAVEGGAKPPSYPEIFMRGAESLVAHQANIIRPTCSDKLDYEGEIAAIIGKKARHVKAEQGLNYIAGYSLFNDATVRDYQRKSSQWTIGKNFDDTGAFGPEFVSADELPLGVSGIQLQTRLNGQVMQDANTSDFIFPMASLIEILSECMTLLPGDVIITGTPAGVGYVRTPPVFMKPGDVIEIEAQGLGILSNTVVDEDHPLQ
ncbi:fumarylacetoacetate hydrolase family protein [Vibrio rarus]|uniref:fumarylacetoacetate hydrolase family protein n=1 Tax=Vibrio rarus TaxID=413403 RepID=UPI0021C2A192|nr:fumarylacetoacetate hydrolase family protein [Vibrio rarus]